ncbi:AAA family ATPase [Rhodococcus sp. GB-02]
MSTTDLVTIAVGAPSNTDDLTQRAECVTGLHLAYRLSKWRENLGDPDPVVPYDGRLDSFLDPDSYDAVMCFVGVLGLDMPETFDEADVLPIAAFPGITVTRAEVVADSARRGLRDPHEVAAKAEEVAAEKAAATAAEAKLRDHGSKVDALFTAAIIEQHAPDGALWARLALDALRDDHTLTRAPGSSRDRKELRLGYKGTELVLWFGAPTNEVAALPPATKSDLAEAVRHADTERRVEQMETQSRARQIEAVNAAAGIELPEFVNLAEHVPSSDPWVIDGLMRRDTNLGLFAQFKAGKSTAVREIIRSLLDGGDVFGRFPVEVDPDIEVVLIDSEMPLDNLQDEYRRAGVQGLDRLRVASIKGCERSFDVRVPEIRAQWAQRIAPGSIIVFDCLYSVLAALGISENDDGVAAVLLGLRALSTDCAALGTIMVHHLGKDSERGARGHSSIEGWPDVLARIQLDGPLASDTQRTFSAYGRGVDIEAAVLTLGSDHRLTLKDLSEVKSEKSTAKRTSQFDADDAAVLEAVRSRPGLNGTTLHTAVGFSVKRVYAACARLSERRMIEDLGRAYPQWHAVAGATQGDPFSTPADAYAVPIPTA